MSGDRVWLNSSEAAAYTGYHRETLVKAAQAQELRGQQRKKGGPWRFHRDWLDAWITGDSLVRAA